MSELKEVSLNIDEMKDFVRHIVNNNRYLQSLGKPPVAVEVIGESGIGKTSATLQLAHEFKFNHVKLNLAQIEEIGDLVGFPIRQFQMCRENSTASATPAPVVEEKKPKTVRRFVDGELKTIVLEEEQVKTPVPGPEDCIWVDEHAVQEYSKQGYTFTGKKQMSYCPPEWIADKVGGGFLILDDWNR